MYFEKPESPRIFENDYLDFFTRVNVLSVPVLFVPIAGACVAAATVVAHVPWWLTIAWAVVGFVAWTLTEYLMHRFPFHYEPTSAVGRRLHFLAHGVHHEYPNDPYRLVMPPWVNLTILFGIVAPIALSTAPSWGWAWLAGYVTGYINYDVTHYYIHHHKPKSARYKRLKAHHANHHYNGSKKFGVSSSFWDRVFGTA